MRILCATDLLPKSKAAIARAGMLADELAAALTLLHVVVPTESRQGLEQTLQMRLAQAKARTQPPSWRARTRPEIVVRPGNPARRIVDALEQSKARLLVLGPHRKRPLRDALEGTVAGKVLTAKRWPLLVVQTRPRTSYRRVLLTLDLSAASASAIRAAESIVIAPDSDVKIIHAHETPYEGMLDYAGVSVDAVARYAAGWRREAMRAVRGLLRSESEHLGGSEIVIEEGPPAAAILRAIENYEPDLIVMGTRGLARLRRALLGSVANRVLHDLPCDALIVPEGSIGAPARRSPHGGLMASGRRRERSQAPASVVSLERISPGSTSGRRSVRS